MSKRPSLLSNEAISFQMQTRPAKCNRFSSNDVKTELFDEEEAIQFSSNTVLDLNHDKTTAGNPLVKTELLVEEEINYVGTTMSVDPNSFSSHDLKSELFIEEEAIQFSSNTPLNSNHEKITESNPLVKIELSDDEETISVDTNLYPSHDLKTELCIEEEAIQFRSKPILDPNHGVTELLDKEEISHVATTMSVDPSVINASTSCLMEETPVTTLPSEQGNRHTEPQLGDISVQDSHQTTSVTKQLLLETLSALPSGYNLAKVEAGPNSYIVIERTESTPRPFEQAEKSCSAETPNHVNEESIVQISDESDVESDREVDPDLPIETVASSSASLPPVSGSFATVDINIKNDDADFDLVQARIPTVAEREIPPSELLDDEDEEFISKLQEGIDNEQSNLLGPDMKFDWTEDFSTFRGVAEQFSGGKTGPTRPLLTPYDAFSAIWDADIISVIVEHTNWNAQNIIRKKIESGTYSAQSRMRKWVNVTAAHIMALFSVFMFMGLFPLGRLEKYWQSTGPVKIVGFQDIMSFHRYNLLTGCLQFVDNHPQSSTSRKPFKLRPIIDHLNKKFPELYVMKRVISLDESLSLWKGFLNWVQTIRTQSPRVGIKTVEVCEASTGYLWKFEVYTGKVEGGSEVSLNDALSGKNCKIVLELLKGLEHKGYCVVMDNFYNCPALARYLKSQGFDCLGTVRANRKHMPEAIKTLKQSVPKGTIVSRHSGDVSVVSWKGSKLVNMISTFHDSSTYVGGRARKLHVKPICVRDYNKGMGGVDVKNQKLSMFLLERKGGPKWYIKMFKRLVNVSVHNAYILHSASLVESGQRPLSYRRFREVLAEEIVERFCKKKPIPGPVVRETRLRMDIHHFPIKVDKRVRCAKCSTWGKRKDVYYKCGSCLVGLCLERCFQEYHTVEDLKSIKND